MASSEVVCSRRRRLLQGGALSVLAMAARPNLVLAQVPPAVGMAVTLGQMALGAAKLFQRTSVSNTDEIIIRMLDNISRQLNVIQGGITLIAVRIEEVRELVEALPSEVVQELSKAQLRGYIVAYGELLRTRENYGKNRKAFIRERTPEVKALIQNIQVSRNVLINYPNQLNIPVLAAALNIEYGCMRLIDESDNVIVPMTGTYQAYFKSALLDPSHGVTKRIAELRKARRDVLTNGQAPQLAVGRLLNSGYGWWVANTGYAELNASLDMTADEQVAELLALGLISADERHITVVDKRDLRYPGRTTGSICNPIRVGGQPNGCIPITQFPTQDELVSNREAARAGLERDVNSLTDKLYVAVSNYHAGVRALNFTQQFS
ncbi:hypothetical protein [Cupriavidus necator]